MKKNNGPPKDEGKRNEIGVSKSINMKKRRNQNPKSMSDPNFYNPALIKKQREFYKNAKYVSKFKKSIKREGQPIEFPPTRLPNEDDNGAANTSYRNRRSKKNQNKAKFSLGEIYAKKREAEDKARREREAFIKEREEERQATEARRKATKEKMYKKTRYGQPVMKYRIEKLLESIQGSQKNN